MTTTKRPALLRAVMCLILLVVAAIAMVFAPETRVLLPIVSILLIATITFALAEALDLDAVSKARAASASFLLIGLACAAGAAAIWVDPSLVPDTAFPRIPPGARIALGALGAVFFGGIGIVGTSRAGRARQ